MLQHAKVPVTVIYVTSYLKTSVAPVSYLTMHRYNYIKPGV